MVEQKQLSPQRVDWVDYAKGICIILVVMMHSTYGVEKALDRVGDLSSFIAWAQPFRMPDFFLLSGLFLSRRIAMPWRNYLDKKVVHFLYFYLLWMGLQLGLKSFGIVQDGGFAALVHAFSLALVQPFGTLWFIYLLPAFFVVTKLLMRVPSVLVFLIAAVLEILSIHTGWIMIDEFASRYVYFFAGYWLAAHVFRLASDMDSLTKTGMFSALLIWAVVHTQLYLSPAINWPGMGLVLGFFGTGAVVTAGVLLSRFKLGGAIGYLGENSIVIYLAFFVFMAASRIIAVRVMPELGPDVISVGVTLAGIIGPLVLMWLTKSTWLRYLFKRPSWAKISVSPTVKLETAPKVWHGSNHDTALISKTPLPR